MSKSDQQQDNAAEAEREIFGDEIINDEIQSEILENEPITSLNKDTDYQREAVAGAKKTIERQNEETDSSPDLASGDLDADWSGTTGEEDSAGTAATPDQDQVEEIARPWGTGYKADQELDVNKKKRELESRRRHDETEGLEQK